jgi:RecA/RadA recombinase
MTKNSPFGDVLKVLENEYAAVADDGTSADVVGFIDTGSYALNALYSGSIYKGMPANKINALAGEEATGKTFFALGIVKNFLDTNDKALSIIFESEGSITKEILTSRGVDTKRVLIVPVETIQQFKTQAIRVVENHLSTPEKDRRPLILVLDSLGMLSTTKEMNDSNSGKEVKDMTRTAEIKAAFRVITLKLSKAKLPLIVTNHVYQTMGMFPTKEMGGGCLVAGTKVKMSDGSLCEIQDIKIGDSVITLLGDKVVTNTFQFSDKELYELTLEDGTIIKCSDNHRFLMDDGKWLTIKEIFDLVNQGKSMKDINILTYDEGVNICLTNPNIAHGIIE